MQFDKSHMTSLFRKCNGGYHSGRSNSLDCAGQSHRPAACLGMSRRTGWAKVEVLLPTRYRAGHVQLRDGFYKEPQNRDMGSGRDLFGQKKDGDNFPVEVSLSSYRKTKSNT
jgi:hypothetical protein